MATFAACSSPPSGTTVVDNDVRDIGQFSGDAGQGSCTFLANVVVDTAAQKVNTEGEIRCINYGSGPSKCAFELETYQGPFGVYTLTRPFGSCTDPPFDAKKSFDCNSGPDCKGQWSASAHVAITGYSGDTWTKLGAGCSWNKSSDVVTCDFGYPGVTIS
jgi:hypothetical protein